MEPHSVAGLGNVERKLLKIFERHGRDGRAITTASLAVHAGLPAQSDELQSALASLIRGGLLEEAGDDPFRGAPVAYRLSRTAGKASAGPAGEHRGRAA